MKRSRISSAVGLALSFPVLEFGALPAIIQSLDEVPEAVRDEYKQSEDGKFVLQLDGTPRGFVRRSELDEFRDNNIQLKRQIEEYENKFGDLDPDKYHDLLKKEEQLNDAKLVEAGKVDELVEQKTAKVKEDADNRVQQMKKERDELAQKNEDLTGRFSSLVINTEAQREIESLDVRLRKGASPDFLGRVQNTFKYEDGKMVARDLDGNVRYNKDGDPMTMRDFLGELTESAPHLFEESKGGGAGGSGDDRGGDGGQVRKISRSGEMTDADIDAVAAGEAVLVD